jgi:4-amino-4-deoxychorismate lyase
MSTDPILALVDGQPATVLCVLDRALHYGDGLFETIACRNSQACFLELHLQRLAAGCARLGIRYEDFPALAAKLREIAAAQPRSIIKLILTRGSATARGYGAGGDEQARTVLLQYPWPPEDPQLWAAGVVARTASARWGENPLLAGLKHLNRLEQVLARAEWTDPSIQEALVFSSSGWLVSGTMSNVFLIRDGRIMTPAITHAGVRGVMRRVVIGAAQAAGVAITETALDAPAVLAAQEIFVTNARIGIWPIRELDGRALPIGPITRQLQQRLRPLLEAAHA